MFKPYLCALACISGAPAWASDLTELEQKWLTAAWPVIVYAKAVHLPLDVIVQPDTKANDVPLALGYEAGRCKLVLSLRNNPQAEASLASAAPPQHRLLIETMAAHEIGHCWRYAQGTWHTLPSGFSEAGDKAAAAAKPGAGKLPSLASLRQARREEAFADLFGLAWVLRFHPEQYQQVHSWLQAQRSEPSLSGGSHNTLAWVQLARDGKRFEPAASLFEQAGALWRQGLRNEALD
ncbi:MAG: hypothetical protein V4488_08420 [Pseudomonadota bacterium]